MENIPDNLRKEILSYIEDKKLYQQYFIEYIHLKDIGFSDIYFFANYTQNDDNECNYKLIIKGFLILYEYHCILRKDGTQQYTIDDFTFNYELLPKKYIAEIFDKQFNYKSGIGVQMIGVQMRIPMLYFPLAGTCCLRISCDSMGFSNITIRILKLKRRLEEYPRSNLNYDISILPILFDMISDNKIVNIDEATNVFYNITGKKLKFDQEFIEHYQSKLPEMIKKQIEMEEMVLI